MENSLESVEKPVKRKLRWYQFSLRSLLIFVTLFAVACSWFAVKMGQAKRQREAVDAIRKTNNGYVVYDDESRQIRFQGQPPPSDNWWCKTFGEDFLCNVVEVHCENADPRTLNLEYLPHLQTLVLEFSHGNYDAGLDSLDGLPQIQSLHIDGYGTNITDPDLVHLKGLIHLTKLNLYDMKITDAGLPCLKNLTELESLEIANAKITDAGLVHFLGMTRLRSLKLFGCQITDAGLIHLQRLTTLQNINLGHTKVTDSGIAKLQKALPDCKIEVERKAK